MTNKFLNNVKQGKNDFWRYLVTSIMSFGVAQFVSVFYLILFVVFQQVLIGTSEFDMTYYFIAIFFSFSISAIFLLLLLDVLHKRNIMSLVNAVEKYDVFGRSISWIKRVRWNKFFKGFLIWSIFIIVVQTVIYIIYPSDFTLNWNFENFLALFILFLIAIPIQVTFEELFFRGYLNQGLSLKIKNPMIIIAISSFVFGLAHLLNGDNVISMISYVYFASVVGLIWSITTLLDNGIEWSTGAHLANNFFAFVIIGGEGSIDNFGTLFSVKDSDPLFGIVFSTVTLFGFLIILILYKKDKILKL